MKFVIVSTGYNCENYVRKCIASVEAQTNSNWILLMMDDGSTDNTKDMIEGADLVLSQSENMGAAYCRHRIIGCATRKGMIEEEDVIILLGMDDELMPNCLDRLQKEYDKGVWMTYGNWINQEGRGLPSDFDLEFSEEVHLDRSYRKVVYRSTAPNTFKKFLFDKIDLLEFKFNGEWMDIATEIHLMLSCLEMCGKEKIGVIKEPIYIYNQDRPDRSINRIGRKKQKEIRDYVKSRTKKQLLER